MKIVNVTVRGGNTAEGATGVSFSVQPYEVIVQITGSREPVLSVPVVDNPLLNRQSYSFSLEGFEVDLEVVQIEEELFDDCGDNLMVDEAELSAFEEAEAQAALDEVLGEPELEEIATLEDAPELESTLESEASVELQQDVEPTLEAPAIDAMESTAASAESSADPIVEELEMGQEEAPSHPEIIAEIPDIIEIVAAREEAPEEEELDTAFFQRDEGGSESIVDATETLVPLAEEQSAEELKHLLEQTQALLKKYDLNSVEH